MEKTLLHRSNFHLGHFQGTNKLTGFIDDQSTILRSIQILVIS